MQVCLTAQQIVFYCNGGDCDDSEHAAIMLRDSIGMPKEKVFVYGGGIAEWTSNGLPIEVGARNSGRVHQRERVCRVKPSRGRKLMDAEPSPGGAARLRSSPRLARWLLGGLFIYLGVSKILHPAEFLTFVRQQMRVTNPSLAGLIAGLGPWLEVLYGLWLISGIARDTAALLGRWWLGAVFIYMGLNKALPHPEAFLKLVREYHMVDTPGPAELDRRGVALVRGVLRSAAAGRSGCAGHSAQPDCHAGALHSCRA